MRHSRDQKNRATIAFLITNLALAVSMLWLSQADFSTQQAVLFGLNLIVIEVGLWYVMLRAQPKEAAPIMAREYKIPPEQAQSAIESVGSGKGQYWSLGDFDYEGMEVMLKGLQMVKAIPDGPFDWSKVIDDSFLPADLRGKK